jgi:outer membrane protein assembly factor BamA
MARMSQLEILNFYGFGNATPWDSTTSFAARQQQWLLQPAVARALGPRSDLSFGPVVQYSVTDSAPGRFLSASQPYGFGHFGQAGLRLGLHHDTRDVPRDPRRGLLVDLTGTFFPALWDVTSEFGAIAAGAIAYLTFPIPMHPVLVLRGGGKKLYGDFPFHEAAFIGGRSTLRSLDPQRYAGDASVYGSAELRLRLARFAFILPVDAGIFGIVDAGRVYVNGDSPGGWHTSAGVGFWVGVPDPSTAVSVCRRPGASGPC